MENTTLNIRPKKHRVIRVIVSIFIVLIVLLLSLVLALLIPAVQTFVAQKYINSIRSKTGTELTIGSVKIKFPQTVCLQDLYVADRNSDTILYLYTLNVDIDILKLFRNGVYVNNLEIENLIAHVYRKNSDDDFNFQFVIDAISPPNTDTVKTPSAPWSIKPKKISLKNIHVTYADGSKLDMQINLDDLHSTLKEFDLNQKRIFTDNLYLKNTSVKIASAIKGNNENDSVRNTGTKTISDIFPDWNFSVNQLSLDDIDFKFDNTEFSELVEGFDIRHIHITQFSTGMNNCHVSALGVDAEIDSMRFNEKCGFQLMSFSVNAKLNEHLAQLKDLKIQSAKSKISGDAIFTYSSYNDIYENPGECNVNLDLKEVELNSNEVLLLNHSLAGNKVAAKFKNSNITLVAKAYGKINNLNVENIQLTALEKTILKAHAKFSGLPDFNKLSFDGGVDLFSTILPDISEFVDTKSINGIHLPGSIEVSGTTKGKPDSFKADFKLSSTYGVVDANVFYHAMSKSRDSVNVEFKAKDILAGKILSDSIYGKTNFSGKAGIVRATDRLYYGSAELMIADAEYNSYVYNNLHIDSRLNGNLYSATISSVDTNLTFELRADADFHNTRKVFSAELDLAKINLKALHISDKNITASSNIKAGLTYGGINNSEISLLVNNTNFVSEEKKNSTINLFDFKAISSAQGIGVTLNSDVLDGNVSGNIAADSIQHIFKTAFAKYFSDTGVASLQPGKNLSFMINVHPSKDIVNLFNSNINELDSGRLEGKYSSNNNEVELKMILPGINYSNVLIDTLRLEMKGRNERLNLKMSCNKVAYKNLFVQNIGINETADRGKIISKISTGDSLKENRYFFANEFEFRKDYFKMKFLPEGLMLAGASWTVDPDNYFERAKSTTGNSNYVYSIQNFVFENEERSFRISRETDGQEFKFRNFALQDLLGIAEVQSIGESREKKPKFIRGDLNGDIVLPFFPETKDVNVRLAINKMYVLDSLAGDLTLNVKAEDEKVNVDVGMVNQENNLSVKGTIDQFTHSPVFDLKTMIDIKRISRFELFTFGELSEMSGRVKGDIYLKGTTERPEINGELGFENAAFRVNSLNFYAKLNHEKILISNKGFHFDNFVIEDAHSKKLIIDGDVLTNNFKKVEFDLGLSAKQFQPINSTVKDNREFYGILSMGADVKLKGDLKSPVIDAKIQIDSITNLTYALPGSELKMVTAEGIVEFRDSLDADTNLVEGKAEYVTDSIMSRIKGINLKAQINMDKGVQFTIDIDPKSGDYLTVKGGAKLDIISNGKDYQNINGIYEVSSGTYQLSFYDLVKKDFIIKPGSTIAWSGRPMDGDMNITAEYVVRTSSVALVANETPSMSEEEKKIFNRRLPYEIKLNIRGLLSKPEISFNITLPSQYLSDNPLVEAKLRQLNSPDMTAQLNKQVFALLVAGSFIADSPMDNAGGSTNIASTAARNSVNGILAGQLNNMSGKYISGVDVNFGLTSYEDYTTGSNDMRTEMDIQVSKKLFNDRVTVEAENSFNLNGSKKENTNSTTAQGYGQFAVIYNLTETGEYKLRAYYQNAYDPFDGDISYSGIALIFEKELDSLWRKAKPVAGQTNENDK